MEVESEPVQTDKSSSAEAENGDRDRESQVGFKRRSWLPYSRQKRRQRGLPIALKPPLVVLNEKFGSFEFDIVPKGEGINAGFNASFSYEGERHEGFGYSKSKAKTEAAKSLLKSLDITFSETQNQGFEGPLQNLSPQPVEPPIIENPPSQTISDFTEDVTNPMGGSFDDTNFSGNNWPINNHPLEMNLRRMQEMRIPFNLKKASEFPAMVLHELFPNIQSQLEWLDTGSTLRFCCKVDIGGQTFHGISIGKRAAKIELAKSVLSKYFGVKYFKSPKSTLSSNSPSTLSKMHPFARVKWVDQNSKFQMNKIEEEGNEVKWKAKLKMKGKEYEVIDHNMQKAKFRVAKMGFEDNYSDDDADMLSPIEKMIDTNKNPLQMFHEYYKTPEFMEEEKQNQASSYFLVAINVDGHIYTASSLSKKRAKLKLALKVFENVHGISVDAWSSLKDDVRKEYVEDQHFPNAEGEMEIPQSGNEIDSIKVTRKSSIVIPEMPKTSGEVPRKSPPEAGAKNPVSILYELHQDVGFLFGDENTENTHARFTCFVTIGGKTFDGYGPNKRSAKNSAAARALEILYGIKEHNIESANKSVDHNHSDISSDFADKIFKAVMLKFSQVFQPDIPYKVIASILMAKEQNGVMLEMFEVLSIGTGTKCIGGECLCNSGKSLNDCHAEIIASRGLRKFFFDQLDLAVRGKESCLEREPKSKLFQLKSGLCLFLYINTAPCGDGRVYNLAQTSSSNKTIGMLRTKIENGQGTVPVPASGIQTIDGILAGERVLTMSCSDKIMKWNVLGIQGSLLTHFMKPVYLKGIIIADQYNHQHLFRSLYSRVADLQNLPQPFAVVKPDFGKISKMEGRDTSKATNLSYNWYYGQTTMEAINGVTGQTPVSMPSRLSKMVFLEKYRHLVKLTNANLPMRTYHSAKLAAQNFQEAKKIMLKGLADRGFGKWIGKPVEYDTFG